MKQVFLPCKINWSAKSEFFQYIKDMPVINKTLFIVGDVVSKSLGLNKLFEDINKTHNCSKISKAKNIPTINDINEILSGIIAKPDTIIAIGGGSAIDIAKMIAGFWYLKDGECSIKEIIKSTETKEYAKQNSNIQIIAVPSTAGTGSEVTSWATLWDINNCKKYSIDAKHLYPSITFIIPEFTATMPEKLTLATGLDALCHATESYWAKESNSITRELSKSAIRIIVKFLPKVLQDRDNSYYREKMCLGSLYAGLAFSQTRTTACHSISYPLTMKFNVEHGFACVMTLVAIFKLNRTSIIELDELLSAFNVKDIHEIQDWIDSITKDIICLNLRSFNIKEDDIGVLTELSFTQGRMNNNPVSLNPEGVYEILKTLL